MQSRTILLAALAAATIALSAPAEARRSANFVDAAAVPAYPTSNWVRTARGRHHAGHQPRHRRVAAYRRHHEAREVRKATRRSFVGHSRHMAYDRGNVISGRPAGCPYQFCGCSASLYVFGKIIPALNLAANWLRFPRTSPAPGMAAARPGHVFIIVSVNGDGTVVAHDGNSGHHLTRIHTISLRGFTVVNPHGMKVAIR
jgi:hypothetical protein